MIQFDENSLGFCDPDFGDQVQFERLHPREPFYWASYEGKGEKFRFQLGVATPAGGGVGITLSSSEVFLSERHAWFKFRGTWENPERLRLFLNAWAIRNLGARPNGVRISDTRKSTDPLINEVADPPSAKTLQALLNTYSPPRGDSGPST